MDSEKNTNGMTLEDLTGMVQRGFEAMGVRFDGVEARLIALETRMTSIEERTRGIEVRLDHHEEILIAIRKDISDLRKEGSVTEVSVLDLEARVSRIEGELKLTS